jgi:hypothetical protein
MAEGFHVPHTTDLPFDLDPVLNALIRVPTHHQYALISIFESQHDKETFVPDQGSKSFLPEGVLLWHLALTRAGLQQVRDDPGVRLRPLLYEAVQAFVSGDGDLVTNYHVVGEEIEAAGRIAGSADPLVCRYTSFEVPVIHERQIRHWTPLDPVRLVRNPSRQDWHDGFDAALLRADVHPPAFLRLAKRAPRIGESVWVFGLPVRSARPKSRSYEDADGTLRVSLGRVVEIQEHTFITDADSFNGYSGGPVLGADGAVLGINWNVYPHTEVDRRAVRFEGGSIHVMATAIMSRLQSRTASEC